MQITLKDAIEKYGIIDVENKSWPNAVKWLKPFILPKDLFFPKWINTYTLKPVVRLYANTDMHAALLAALQNVKKQGVGDELISFDGLFNIRAVRGRPGHLSAHAYALAIDINAEQNPLGGPVGFSRGFIECWTDVGFTSGANFSRPDGQHFSMAWE